jgi:AraC family mar-sox-rob regulon transcriptional activator
MGKDCPSQLPQVNTLTPGKGMPMAKRSPLGRRVLRQLLLANLNDTHAADIAGRLHVSPSTLRRRLRGEHTSYQQLLDRVRRYRCERALRQRWLPGKSMAPVLGFRQVNSFYRAFGKWTGMTYTQYKKTQREKNDGD